MAKRDPGASGVDTAQKQDAYGTRPKDNQHADADERAAAEAAAAAAVRAANGADVRTALHDAGNTGETGPGPSPYDLADGRMPRDRMITKGERERPGPTADELGEPGRGVERPHNRGASSDVGDDEHARRLKDVEATEGPG